ncbi:uncharacterized protein [Parasteatoda tepidariorum]|uniref:uncharacterized protein n=1 Tax=Parasteatoda tepidariorum TaxID=114398 RepID=UPI0039BCB841
MYPTMQFQARKLDGHALLAANANGHANCRLIVIDRTLGLKLLVGTGADISVLLPSQNERNKIPSILKLVAANGSQILVYGTRKLNLDIGLRRIFPWTFTIADVSRPILGADFLSHYDILVDLKSKSLIDKLTNVTFCGKISYE